MKTGWKVIGEHAERRIAEFRANDEDKNLLPYEHAKRIALRQLREQACPLFGRIVELEGDVFKQTGALPPLKAWQRQYGKNGYVVTAKSKKRARELVNGSQRSFDHWSECDSDWWYHLAHREAVWIEELDESGLGKGVFHPSLTPDEAAELLREHAAPYRTISVSSLLEMVGEEQIDSGISAGRTPYTITTNVVRSELDNSTIHVNCRIDDGCDVRWQPRVSIERTIPQIDLVVAVD